MKSLITIILFCLAGVIVAGFILLLLPLLIVGGILLIILKTVFGVKTVQWQWTNFKPRQNHAPAEEAETEIPASQAIIDTEIIELSEEETKKREIGNG